MVCPGVRTEVAAGAVASCTGTGGRDPLPGPSGEVDGVSVALSSHLVGRRLLPVSCRDLADVEAWLISFPEGEGLLWRRQ